MHDYYIDDDGDAEEAAWGDEEETKKKCKVKKLFCISLTRAWDVVLCIFDRSTRSRPPENRKNPSTEAATPTVEAADELVVKLRLWVSSVTLSRPKIMMGLRCYHQVGRAAGCRPSCPTQSWSQKERELPIPCNFRRSRCLGKWAATVWRRRWNSWKIKHSRAITNNLLALHHPENALFLRNWLQSSLVLYTKDYTWPIISSSRLLKANHPFCSCRNPILISQKIRSWAFHLRWPT